MKVKRALISVNDKKGVVDLARSLAKLGVEIISTGGTARLLKDKGVKVTHISDYTGFPEIMDGRVRTLHPRVHGGILGVREKHGKEMEDHEIKPIDMVVVNLYQFEKTVEDPKVRIEDTIENIDIGGPTLIRSAAKNYRDVVVVVDPDEYNSVISKLKSKGDLDLKTRQTLALKAFRRTADYDSQIDRFLSKRFAGEEILRMKFRSGKNLRYGENWHQKAKVFVSDGISSSLLKAEQLQGKEMSYNNYIDSESALEAVKDMGGISVSIIKHTNPCGYATGKNIEEALENAWNGDPVSAFGSVIAFTKPVNKESAEFLKDKFVEVLIAPGFDEAAKEILKEKENLRLLEIKDFEIGRTQYRFLSGGLLEQEIDSGYSDVKDFKNMTEEKFNENKKLLARFACLACKHTKSNAIVVAREYKPGLYQVIGMGGGQPNRIGSLKIAIEKAKENLSCMGLEGKEISECVLASDSFFPFTDSIEFAHEEGIRYIVQPGGSVKDKEVIKMCDVLGIAMIFTGRRMFKH